MTAINLPPAGDRTEPQPELIRFDNVHMVFVDKLKKPVHALRGLDLSIARGSVVGMLGPNGCGKTTSISCLLGLLDYQYGGIYLSGRRIDTIPRIDREHFYGVLLEDTRLPPFLTVAGVIRYLCRLRGVRRIDQRREFDRVVEMTGIGALLKQRVAVLSKGQARRVGLGAALVGDPPLLILDEPSAGLDVSSREEFNDLVRMLRDDRRTILIASHLLSDIEATCSHIAIMREGHVILYEHAETMLQQARIRNGGKDIMVDERYVPVLDRLGIAHEAARYPGLRRLHFTEPEYTVMLRLAQEEVVPERIEPQVNLVSLYLDRIREEDGS